MTPQKISALSKGSTSAPQISEQQIEAARYAVLRRLSPCLHHHMVRPLQPIGLIYGVMHHKLCAEKPDLPAVRMEADKINEYAKAALAECADMGTWLAPEPGVLTRLDSGVSACVGLLASMLHFCGFRLVNEVDEMPVRVQKGALRMILMAALLEMSDSLGEPATLTLSATASKDEAVLLLQVSQKGEGCVDRYDSACRKLVWADVQALAAAENVGLSRQDGRVTMTFACEPAEPVH